MLLGLGPGGSSAADTFSGNYGAVCFGMRDDTGGIQHYSWYASHTFDGAGGLTGGGQYSRQGGDPPPLAMFIVDSYQQFRREGMITGLESAPENHGHGRLSDDLDYGVFLPMHDDNNWYLKMMAPKWDGGAADDSYLNAGYWFVQYQLKYPSGGPESHMVAYGSETYDGAGHVSTSYNSYEQGVGFGIGGASLTYSVSAAGGLTRYSALERGYMLDNGFLLATALVDYDDRWGITLSTLKASGPLSEADLQGPYWMTMYQYVDSGGADQHVLNLAKAYFDGAGTVWVRTTANAQGVGLVSTALSMPYTVAADGAFTFGSFSGGVGRNSRVILAAQASLENYWGFLVFLKRSGIEDPSPMCLLLGPGP